MTAIVYTLAIAMGIYTVVKFAQIYRRAKIGEKPKLRKIMWWTLAGTPVLFCAVYFGFSAILAI